MLFPSLTTALRLELPQLQAGRTLVDRRESFETPPPAEYRRVWICEACTFENEELQPHLQHQLASNERERCEACGSFRAKQEARASLTLAQKRGLVACPPPKLTRDDWDRCEKQAEDRGDLAHPCSICRESFGVKEHVILSCSHVFHLDCITSFERFLRTNQRVCPLCRKQDYQKRCTAKASVHHRQVCAKRIQVIDAIANGGCRLGLGGRLTRAASHRPSFVAFWLVNASLACGTRCVCTPLRLLTGVLGIHDARALQFYRAGKGDPVRRRRFLASRSRVLRFCSLRSLRS